MEQVVTAGQHLPASGSVVVAEVDVVDFGIRKIDAFGGQIQRQSVGPVNLAGDDGRAVGSVHVDTFDARMITPIRPEEDAATRIRTGIQGDATRLFHVLGDENHPVGSVLAGHFDRVEPGVDPVKIVGDPIQRQAFNQIRTAADDGRGHSGQFLAEDFLDFHVVPVEDVGVSVGSHSHHVLHVHRNHFDGFLLQIRDEQ